MGLRRTNRTYRGKQYHDYYLDRVPGGKLERVPGVTTLLNAWPKGDVLTNWAARTVAEYAADHLDEINALEPFGRQRVIDALSGVHRVRRDEAAAKGTDVHEYAAKLVMGEAVNVPETLEPYVRGYAAWLDEWDITPIIVEGRVASRGGWFAGTFDLACKIGAGPWAGRTPMMDVKTGRGVYGETALQVAAYATAEFLAPSLDEELPLPEFDCTGVIHCTPEGTAVYQLADSPLEIRDHYRVFQHVAYVQQKTKAINDTIDMERPLYAAGEQI